MYRILLFLK